MINLTSLVSLMVLAVATPNSQNTTDLALQVDDILFQAETDPGNTPPALTCQELAAYLKYFCFPDGRMRVYHLHSHVSRLDTLNVTISDEAVLDQIPIPRRPLPDIPGLEDPRFSRVEP
jgi:hypothetical protein